MVNENITFYITIFFFVGLILGCIGLFWFINHTVNGIKKDVDKLNKGISDDLHDLANALDEEGKYGDSENVRKMKRDFDKTLFGDNKSKH